MAYLDSTVLLDFQATEATNEKRDVNVGMVDLAKDSTPFVDFIPPSVLDLLSKSSSARNARIPYMLDQQVTVTNVPGFANIPVNLGESGNYFFSALIFFQVSGNILQHLTTIKWMKHIGVNKPSEMF